MVLLLMLLCGGILAVCMFVHGVTFAGIDPMQRWPLVMWLHVVVLAVFALALVVMGRKKQNQDRLWQAAPAALQWLTVLFFVYAFINFIAFFRLSEGGSPDQRDGKYVLQAHGRVIRELSEAEYHQQRAYVVRGFSGHWMVFASAPLTFLAGAYRLGRMGPQAGRSAGSEPTAKNIDPR